jgi:hypothetical protein
VAPAFSRTSVLNVCASHRGLFAAASNAWLYGIITLLDRGATPTSGTTEAKPIETLFARVAEAYRRAPTTKQQLREFDAYVCHLSVSLSISLIFANHQFISSLSDTVNIGG